VNPDTVRASLSVTAERARAGGLLSVATDCETLALGLVEPADTEVLVRHLSRLADVQTAQARELFAQAADPAAPLDEAEREAARTDARRLLVRAGEQRVRLAGLDTADEAHASAEVWAAASLFDEAEDHQAAIKLLRRFINEHPDAEILPRVLLRLGRSLQAEGLYADAIEAYQRNLSSYPRSPHANAALIPLAECFMALGSEHEASAEEALRRIIDNSTIFTPQAPAYRDAMFLIADLFSRQERFEAAIAALDEILQRYPDDIRRPRALFLLAQAHYKSAHAIREEILQPEFVGERNRLQGELQSRLSRAGRLFHDVITELEAREAAELSELEQVYLQEARLHEAACHFEVGEYAAALALYERAAWLYKASPAALGAYVQVINCDLHLGRREDAETALRRAQFLVTSLEDEAFASAGDLQSREQWRRYFDWVGQTLTRTE
jgi:TolA-binding protein